MIFRALIIPFFIFQIFQASAADSTSVILLRGAQNRLDLFTGFEYGRSFRAYYFTGSFEVGVNRSFIQQRFFPRLILGVSRDLLVFSPHFLAPEFNLGISSLKVNALNTGNHYYLEYLFGFRYMTKGKVKFVSGVMAGWMTEYLRSQLDQRYKGFGSWGYEFKLGLGYAL